MYYDSRTGDVRRSWGRCDEGRRISDSDRWVATSHSHIAATCKDILYRSQNRKQRRRRLRRQRWRSTRKERRKTDRQTRPPVDSHCNHRPTSCWLEMGWRIETIVYIGDIDIIVRIGAFCSVIMPFSIVSYRLQIKHRSFIDKYSAYFFGRIKQFRLWAQFLV